MKVGHQRYRYRGFAIEKGGYRDYWLVDGFALGGLYSAPTLKWAKAQIDFWLSQRLSGASPSYIPEKMLGAVDHVIERDGLREKIEANKVARPCV